MDAADVSTLIQRIQELEKENARLKAILDKNGIEYESFEFKNCIPNQVETLSVSTCQFTLQEKVAIFQSVFQGRDDVFAFVSVCKTWNVPYYIERSSYGNGAHVWIFFDTPVTAFKARKLGNAILTEAMNSDVRLSFKSYDRFFPNQDTLAIQNFMRSKECASLLIIFHVSFHVQR